VGEGQTSLETNFGGDRVVAAEGDVVDEETDHALAFALGGAGIGPQSGKVRRQRRNAFLVLLTER
jgi:hypothetical protein